MEKGVVELLDLLEAGAILHNLLDDDKFEGDYAWATFHWRQKLAKFRAACLAREAEAEAEQASDLSARSPN